VGLPASDKLRVEGATSRVENGETIVDVAVPARGHAQLRVRATQV